MLASSVIINQLKKISNFIILLFFLFAVNVIFNLNYKWEWMTIIMRVYLFILSFFLIYNFSTIDIEKLKDVYRKFYGWKGIYILFFVTRLFPFIFIYFLVILFTVVTYEDYYSNWPVSPLIDTLDGRYSNTILYSLILLYVLKLNRAPKIAITVFFVTSILYYIFVQRFVYSYFQSGFSVSVLKLLQISLFLFFLINEFFFDRRKLLKSLAVSVLSAAFFYFSIVAFHIVVYKVSRFGSFSQIKTGTRLLRMGYSFPLQKFSRIIGETSRGDVFNNIVDYAILYNYEMNYTPDVWERLIVSGDIKSADRMCAYIAGRDLTFSYEKLINYAVKRSEDSGKDLILSENFTRFFSAYYSENSQDFMSRFNSGNDYYKIWAIKVIGNSRVCSSLPFLLDILTGVDQQLAREAYFSLILITGKDYSKELKVGINSPQVYSSFMKTYRNLCKAD